MHDDPPVSVPGHPLIGPRPGSARCTPFTALACALFSGCTLIPPKAQLDTTALHGHSVEVVVNSAPSFYADNSDRRLFGFVGVFVMAHEGNRMVKRYGLVDPSIALAESLRQSIAHQSAPSPSTPTIGTAPGAAPDPFAAATAPGPQSARAGLKRQSKTKARRAGSSGAAALVLSPGTGPVATPAPAEVNTKPTKATTSAAAVASTTVASLAEPAASPMPVVPGDPGASRPDLTLKVQTTNWEYRPFRGHGDQYYVIYAARIDLVDNVNGRLLARERCEVTPTVEARLTEEELLANDARKLQAELAAASALCLATFRSRPIATLLGLTPIVATR